MPEKPVIYQGGQAGNDLYAGQSFPGYFPDPFAAFPFVSAGDTSQFAGVDPVIDTVANPHGGVQTEYKTASGATPLQITDAVKGQILNLMTNIMPVQDLHGYANPWPAGGGVNKYDAASIIIGYLDSSGAFVNNGSWCISDYIYITGDITITGFVNDGYSPYSCWYDSSKQFISSFKLGTNNLKTVTPPAGAEYVRISVPYIFREDVQVEYGTVATSWSPYSNICPITGWTGCSVYISPTTNPADATVYPCAWQDEAGTVYGGRIDVATGWMEVTHKTFSVSSWSGQWGAVDNGFAVFRSLPDGIRFPGMLSDQFVYSGLGYTSMPAWTFGGGNGVSSTVTFIIGSATTYAEAQQWFVDNGPITVYYQLDTPQYYQVPAVNIFTLDGTNHIWTNCGDTVNVGYAAVK